MKNLYLTISIILGIIPQLMVIWGLHKKTMRLSFSTYFIWFILNVIICIASIVEKGNYALSLVYMLLNFTISFMILRDQKKISFPPWERFVIVLSIMSIIIWYFTNGTYAVIAASIASFIGGIPQFAVVYRHPQLTSPTVWMFGTLAPLFSVFAGANWSIVERFYPMTFFVYGVIGLALLMISRTRNKKTQ